ncbi:nitrite reductase [Peribacillus sp. NPDC096379]|uniref:nitrite reductase n=1 Tax=Peribacillus sp. NPDC096379 TaxID=3364393 RepID=UPI003800D438
MKKFWRVLGSLIIALFAILLSLVSSTDLVSGGRTGLKTDKIEKNIEKLKQFSWFEKLYENEQHHRSFFVSLKVRKYLESSIRVNRLKRSKREQERFIHLLEEVAELRIKNK